MAAISSIEWTELTWNPVRGCSRLTPGCQRCYAERMAYRFSGTGQPYEGLVKMTTHGPVWTGKVLEVEKALTEPFRWAKPSLVFVNSMSDLFHEGVSESFIRRVFATMQACPQHRFQVLTKRSERLAAIASKLPWPKNVWMGVSVENSKVLYRVEHLKRVPAAVRFLSCEPLLAPLGLLDLRGIHWVIVGGESGPRARPMEPEWVTSIHRQCRSAKVAFFFKQWGGVQKHKTGRQLNGRTYDEMPAAVPA